ncbi:hypothetical protein UlMin_034813 [Ulmus minor]
MEILIPKSPEFDFGSAMTSPYSSAPSTPKRFGDYFFSAPTSPSRMSDFYRDFEEFSGINGGGDGYGSRTRPSVPYKWEENPGTPKATKEGDDFAFDFSEDLERTSLSAEELFDGGKIRPLKPPPRLQSPLAQGKKMSSDVLSPRRKSTATGERGRERTTTNLSSSNSGRRVARSLSPLRDSQYPWEEEQQNTTKQQEKLALTSKSSFPPRTSSSSSSSSSKGSKRWSFKDFLLFRSASEGRATDKDPLRKYSALAYKKQEDIKNSSFRSTDGKGSKRRGPVSAHERHYTTNKKVSEDLKKKTFLPYKQGILGRLAFNPAIHALANGFGSLTRA